MGAPLGVDKEKQEGIGMAIELPQKGDKSSAELVREGWERRATYDEPRLTELVEMYQELGYEVYLESLNPSEETGCAECLKAAPEKYTTIYTRKSAGV